MMKRLIRKANSMVCYHGTTLDNAIKIVNAGAIKPYDSVESGILNTFELRESYREDVVYLTTNLETAKIFANVEQDSFFEFEVDDEKHVDGNAGIIFVVNLNDTSNLIADDTVIDDIDKAKILLAAGVELTDEEREILESAETKWGKNNFYDSQLHQIVTRSEYVDLMNQYVDDNFSYEDTLNGVYSAVAYKGEIPLNMISEVMVFPFGEFKEEFGEQFSTSVEEVPGLKEHLSVFI